MDQVAPELFLVKRVYFYAPSQQQLTPGLYRKVGDKMQRVPAGETAAVRGGRRRTHKRSTSKRRGATKKRYTRTQKKRGTRK
jgi:hypothetical protein